MRTSVTYISSSGNTYDLNIDGVFHKRNVYGNWEWGVEGAKKQYGTRVTGFTRAAAKYKAELLIYGENQKQRLNALHDDFELDIRNHSTGRLIINDFYIDCFIISVESRDLYGAITDKIEIYSPSGFWYKNFEQSFVSTVVDDPSADLDFPFDYPHDYKAAPSNVQIWETETVFPSEFTMKIYGPAVNPRITINGYPYIIYTTINNGETLIIDSRTQTVMCGERNLFDSRNKVKSVFEKIPAGQLAISWGDFNFDFTIYMERSEPRW